MIEKHNSRETNARSRSLAEGLLREFDREMPYTRKILERVPSNKLAWKPHERSASLGWIANFLAVLPTWVIFTIQRESFDVAPPEGYEARSPLNTTVEILDLFDRNVKEARSAIVKATDQHLLAPWTVLSGGRPLFAESRIDVLGAYVLNHTVHHRAQLGVYLRLNDIPLPGIYGPSADEAPSGF
jgi:uncharacterized damage-inducible protein DinB